MGKSKATPQPYHSPAINTIHRLLALDPKECRFEFAQRERTFALNLAVDAKAILCEVMAGWLVAFVFPKKRWNPA
jgi:hypothetical protein